MSSISGISSSSNAWAAASNQRNQHQAKMMAKVDSDGSVDATELDSMLSNISEKTGVSLGDNTELLSQMDSDGDGGLSSSELEEGMKSLMPPPPSTMAFAQARVGSETQDDLFSKIDANGDGSLDKGEVQALADKMKADTGEDIGPDFTELDTDGDGSLTQAEFEAGRPSGPSGPGGPGGPGGAQGPQAAGGPPPAGGPGGAGGASASSETTYDPLDTDQDGTVSQMERLAGVLKDLAQSDQDDSSGSNTEIARLAQKLYEQISNTSLFSDAAASQVNETA